VKSRLKCPVCQKPLPTSLVFASELKKYQCASCTNWIMPTQKSMSKIKLVMGTFSFISGIPLGAYCCYLWFGSAQPWFALYFLLFGTAGIFTVVSVYSRAQIRFLLCQG